MPDQIQITYQPKTMTTDSADCALSQPSPETSATGALTDIQLWELLPKRLEQNLLAMVQVAAPHHNLTPIDLLQIIAPDFIDYARAVLQAKLGGRGQEPSVADVDELCAEFGFHYADLDSLEMLRDMIAAALARWVHASAAAPEPRENPATLPAPAPETPAEALAVRPLLEQVAAMANNIGARTVGEIAAISSRAEAWLRDNPPGARSCVESAAPARVPGDVAVPEPVAERLAGDVATDDEISENIMLLAGGIEEIADFLFEMEKYDWYARLNRASKHLQRLNRAAQSAQVSAPQAGEVEA
jgi:hypothetical protein